MWLLVDPAPNYFFLTWLFLKVYFLDKNKATGEETQRSFNNQHGEGQAKFICCDVTSKDQLEGYCYTYIWVVNDESFVECTD